MIADLSVPGRPAPGGPASQRLPLTPARRGILAVGVPVILALIGATAYSLVSDVGTGSYPVKYAIPVSDGRLTMNFGGGDLTLQGTASGTAQLTGKVTYSLVRPHISVVDRGAQGAVFTFTCGNWTGNCGLNGTADIPSAAAATIATDGGDLTASDLTGDVDLGSDGGNITATSIGSTHVTADSGGGDIEIVFTRVPRNIQVSADGGDVTIVVPSGPTAYDVTATPDGGNVSDGLPQATSSSHVITVTSGGGDITIEQAT